MQSIEKKEISCYISNGVSLMEGICQRIPGPFSRLACMRRVLFWFGFVAVVFVALVFCLFVILFLFLLLSWDGTQGLVHARQVLCCLAALHTLWVLLRVICIHLEVAITTAICGWTRRTYSHRDLEVGAGLGFIPSQAPLFDLQIAVLVSSAEL